MDVMNVMLIKERDAPSLPALCGEPDAGMSAGVISGRALSSHDQWLNMG